MAGEPTQAAGGDGREGAPDGVNDAPGKTGGGGESAGGAYPDPGGGAKGGEGGFLGHGGQSEQRYSGPAEDEGSDTAVTE